jgi:hypothetical protein
VPVVEEDEDDMRGEEELAEEVVMVEEEEAEEEEEEEEEDEGKERREDDTRLDDEKGEDKEEDNGSFAFDKIYKTQVMSAAFVAFHSLSFREQAVLLERYGIDAQNTLKSLTKKMIGLKGSKKTKGIKQNINGVYDPRPKIRTMYSLPSTTEEERATRT